MHSQALSGTLTTGPNTSGEQIAGQSGGIVNRSLKGSLDDLMIFDAALSASEIDSLALAGSGSLCQFPANLTVTAPPTVVYGGHFLVDATLTDGLGRPLNYRNLRVTSDTTPGYVWENSLTYPNGSIRVGFPISSQVPIGDFPNGITVTFEGDGAFGPVQAHASITVLPSTPPVFWSQPAPIVYGTPLGAAQLNAVAMPGTFVYSPPAGTVLDAGTHTLSVTFTPNDPHYAERTATTTIVVNKATPVVTWANPAPITERVPLGSTQLNATASVPGTFAYSPSYWALLPPGTHTLTANFTPASANYNSTSKTVTVKVKAYPVISWPTPAAITYPTTLSGGQLNATANVAGTFTYLPVAGTLLDAGTHTLYLTFTPSNTDDYVSESTTTTIEVLKGTVNITWPELNPITYGEMLTGLHLNAEADAVGGGWFTYSPPYGTILNAGTHTVTATFSPNPPYNYHPATATRELLVRKAWPQLSWPGELASIRYGTPLSDAQLYATAVVPGTITYNYAAGTVLIAGTHIIRMTYTPDDPINYHTLTGSKNLFVDKGIPAITWSNPAPIVYGTPLSASQLNATAAVPGTFSYSPALGAIVPAGTQPLYLTFYPADSANYYNTAEDVTIVVEKRTPVITWSNPAAIVHGTALTSTQLNATTDVGTGTLVYSPPIGTVLSAGAGQTLTVTYQPAFGQANNYNPASATVTVDVLKVAPVVNWLPATGLTYGTPLGAPQLNATSSLPGTFSYAPGAGTVLPAGTHIVTGTFTPADSMNHAGSVETRQVTVLKATAALSWATPAAMTYGTPLSSTQLNATANVAGTFSYAPAAGTVLGAGSHTLLVTFTPDDAANYNGSSANVTLNMAKAATTVSWSNPANVVYGARARRGAVECHRQRCGDL